MRASKAFLASDSGEKSAQLARRHLKAFRRSREFYDYHRASELVDRLEQILDLIENAVLPANPSDAFRLIVQFIECDRQTFEKADDSDGIVGGVFRRACDLFARAAKITPSSDVLPTLQRLLAANDFGARDHLLDGVGEFLDRPHLDAFIEETRAAIAIGGDSALRSRCHLKSIAESIRDPVFLRKPPTPAVSTKSLQTSRLMSLAITWKLAEQARRWKDFLPAPEACAVLLPTISHFGCESFKLWATAKLCIPLCGLGSPRNRRGRRCANFLALNRGILARRGARRRSIKFAAVFRPRDRRNSLLKSANLTPPPRSL